LTNKGKKLDKKKTIKDYGITYQNYQVQVNVPEYMLTSKGIVKLMKVAGFWEYNQQMLDELGLKEDFNKALLTYGMDKKNHAMTKCLKTYLLDNYFD